jgi:hypothetical protein
MAYLRKPVGGELRRTPAAETWREQSQRRHRAIAVALDDWDVYSRPTQAYRIGLIVAQAF